jgi:GntR family transcriptional regulator
MPEPAYLRLKEGIVSAIADGTYKPHARLPSQRDFGEEFGLSHMTVRRAINELLQEGLIYARQGSGLFVAEPKRDAELGPLIGFTEDMRLRGMTASSRLLDRRIVSASTMLASILGVVVGRPLLFLRRLRLADEEPMAIQSAFMPASLVPGLIEMEIENVSIYDLLRTHFRYRLVDAQSSASAELASAEEAELLQLAPPAALLVTEQITFIEGAGPIEFARSLYRGDRYRLQPPLRRPPTAGSPPQHS